MMSKNGGIFDVQKNGVQSYAKNRQKITKNLTSLADFSNESRIPIFR